LYIIIDNGKFVNTKDSECHLKNKTGVNFKDLKNKTGVNFKDLKNKSGVPEILYFN
jgi:hypothetical protein